MAGCVIGTEACCEGRVERVVLFHHAHSTRDLSGTFDSSLVHHDTIGYMTCRRHGPSR